MRIVPLILLHAVVLFGLIWMPLSLLDVTVCALLYALRMFAITGFYHRYFGHKAFKTYRWHQFLWAVIGAAATQRGPIWWAANHRAHHQHTETDQDPHNARRGFWWSHIKWFITDEHYTPKRRLVKDLERFAELRWLDRFDLAAPVLLIALLIGVGEWHASAAAAPVTSGVQLAFWGYAVSTVLLLHVTLCINSLCHRFGRRRYATSDDSRNSWWLALLTFGEGWHNNHHRYCGSARQGFAWWEIDLTYYVLRAMAAVGLIWDLREVPQHILIEGRLGSARNSEAAS